MYTLQPIRKLCLFYISYKIARTSRLGDFYVLVSVHGCRISNVVAELVAVLAKEGIALVASDLAVPRTPDGDEASAVHLAHPHFGAASAADAACAGRVLAPRHPVLLVAEAAQKHAADQLANSLG